MGACHSYHRINTTDDSFTGTALFDFCNGNTFKTVFWGQLYPSSDPDWVTFLVQHIIIGGTGTFVNASGTFYGVDGNFNVVTGEDLGGYVGDILVPGKKI